jgi:hypothetical protein
MEWRPEAEALDHDDEPSEHALYMVGAELTP